MRHITADGVPTKQEQNLELQKTPFYPPSGSANSCFSSLTPKANSNQYTQRMKPPSLSTKFLIMFLLLASFHGVAVCQENQQEQQKEVQIVPAYFVGIRWASTGQKFPNWEDREAVVEPLPDRTKFEEKKAAFLAASTAHYPKIYLVEGKRAFILFEWLTPVTGQGGKRKRMDVELLSGANVTKIREEMAKRVIQNAAWYLTQPREVLVWLGVEGQLK